MTCDVVRHALDAYVDSACSPDQRSEIEVHLRGCPSCAAEAVGRFQIKRMTHAAATRYSPSPEFRSRIEKNVLAKRRPAWASAWMPRLVMAAAALVLVVASLALWMRHAAREQALAELLDLHVATLASANPVDVVSTDRHTVKPWFQGKVPFTFNLPDLQNSSFKLIGGRVVYFQHSPGAQLLFQLRNHEMSVFIVQGQASAIPLTGVTAAREMAFSVETWNQDGLRYAVIGDAGPADIHELARLMREAK